MLDSFASPEFHSYGNSWSHVTTIVIMSASTLFNSPTHSFGPVDYMDMLVSCIVRIIHLLVEYFGQKNKTCSSHTRSMIPATISPPRHHCWGQKFWFIFQTSSSIISNILEMNSHAIALLTNSSFDISPSPSMSTISKISFVLSFRTSSGTCAQKLIVIMVTILASTSIPTIV